MQSSSTANRPDFRPEINLEIEPAGRASSAIGKSPVNFNAADLGARPGIYADAARIAGRINAASVSDEEHQAWLAERQALLDKKFESGLTGQESNRLEYVRWSLDRIEDAKHGFILDQLESYVSQYEIVLTEIQRLQRELEGMTRHDKA
jgi:hypothetical protein